MITSNYNCTQSELYAMSDLAWNSCNQHLSDFTAFSPAYDATLITNRQTEIATAEDIPSDQARTAAAEILRIQMNETATACLANWQKLKRYISKAFPENQQKPKLEEAGSNDYLKASQNNWEKVRSLNQAAQAFLTNNQATLEANNNMPTTFITDYTTPKDTFLTQHQSFLDAEETARQGTQDKIMANNQLHKNLMDMLLDGQEIFKTDEAVRKQFIFAELLYLVRGAGTAGVKGTITNQSDTMLITGATISIPSKDRIVTSDSAGRYNISPIAAGTYAITIEADGYQTKTIENFEIRTGTISTLNIELDAI